MGVFKFILRILGWLVTIILQYAASNLVILLFSIIFAGVDTISRIGWLALLLVIWIGFLLGLERSPPIGEAAFAGICHRDPYSTIDPPADRL